MPRQTSKNGDAAPRRGGRPPVSEDAARITVGLTLTAADLDWLDRQERPRATLIRELIQRARKRSRKRSQQ